MLEKLVDLILQWWKEKPRVDLVRGLIRLRDCMDACRNSYDRFLATELFGGVYSPGEFLDWQDSVKDLERAYEEVNRILEILGPAAESAIRDYTRKEMESLKAVASLRDQRRELGIFEALGETMEPIEHERNSNGAGFMNDASTNLDAFLRATFTVEEIQAAMRPRSWYKWLKKSTA
jgi:hypothetical protein